MRKIYCVHCKNYKEFNKPGISCICYKTLLLSSICNKCGSEIEQIFMRGEPIEIAKILSLINNTEKNQKIYNEAWRKHKCGI